MESLLFDLAEHLATAPGWQLLTLFAGLFLLPFALFSAYRLKWSMDRSVPVRARVVRVDVDEHLGDDGKETWTRSHYAVDGGAHGGMEVRDARERRGRPTHDVGDEVDILLDPKRRLARPPARSRPLSRQGRPRPRGPIANAATPVIADTASRFTFPAFLVALSGVLIVVGLL